MKSPAHRSRHVLKAVLGAVAVVLLLMAGALVLKPSWLAGRLRGQLEAMATQSLGRPVTIEKLEAHWLPRPGATLTHLRVEGEGDEPPFLEASRVAATVQLWPLLRSLGKDVRVGSVVLDDMKLNLVRREDGTWNYESPGGTQAKAGRETLVEDLRIRKGVVSVMDPRAAGGTAAVALRNIDAELKHLGQGMALEGTMKATLAVPKQNVAMGFTVDVDAEVKTVQGQYVLTGHGAARGLRLRGDPASGSFTFSSHVDPANAKAAKVSFTQVALKGPGLDLGGTASVQVAPTRVRFALRGTELDLKHLLGAVPREEASSTALPASVRARLGRADVGGTLKLAKLHHGALVVTDVDAEAKLDEGVLLVQRGEAAVYGGHVDLTGSRVDLRKAQPAWSLKAVLADMDAARAFQSLSGHAALRGQISGELQLTGTGADWAQARNDVIGGGNVRLRDGALMSADIGAAVAPVLEEGLAALGSKKAEGKVQKAEQGTRLKDLEARFKVKDGWVAFTQPMAFQSDIGNGTLTGRVGLDERLELRGTINASEQFVSAIIHGEVPLTAPVTIPLTITGTLKAPEVKPGSPADIAKHLLPVKPLLKSMEKPVNQARKGLGDLFKRPSK